MKVGKPRALLGRADDGCHHVTKTRGWGKHRAGIEQAPRPAGGQHQANARSPRRPLAAEWKAGIIEGAKEAYGAQLYGRRPPAEKRTLPRQGQPGGGPEREEGKGQGKKSLRRKELVARCAAGAASNNVPAETRLRQL